jgi:hypothetical protein
MNVPRLESQHVQQLTLDTEPWLSCDDCFALVDRYVEGLVNGDVTTMPGMRAHLRGCPACAEEATTLAVLVAEDAGEDPRPALAFLDR